MTVWSIGHSTRSLTGFVDLLNACGVEQVADIRTVPKSRRHPHFHTDALALSLSRAGIAYVHLPRLGGFRRPAESPDNAAWRNRSFRAYADYALTEEFAVGLSQLRALASTKPTAMMCSELLWWRCHRRLIADRLLLAGEKVCHVAALGRSSWHELTPFAQVGPDGHVTYPATDRRASGGRAGPARSTSRAGRTAP